MIIADSGDSSGSGMAIYTPTNGFGYIRFGDPDNGAAGGLSYGHTGDKLFLRAGGTDNMTIDSSGKVGIGTTTPGTLLHVSSGTSGDAELRIEADADNSNEADLPGISLAADGGILEGVIALDNNVLRIVSNVLTDGGISLCTGTTNVYTNATDVVSAAPERMRIDPSGRVGVGGNPSVQAGTEYMLFVEVASGGGLNIDYPTTSTTLGLAKGYSNVGGTDTLQFIIRTDGDFESRTNSYGGTSDATIKQDIVDAPSQWDDIKAVQLRKYRLIDDVVENGDDALVQLGVVAQELEAVGLGGLVVDADPDNDKPYKSVKYSVLLLKALGALQEAMARIEALEAN
jgi:hypothetical protein